MGNPKDKVKKSLRESVEAVIDESSTSEQGEQTPVEEGKLPPWLDKKKKGKDKEEDMEEAKKSKEDEEDMEEAKKVVKEQECSCNEDDDRPWCDDCPKEDEEDEMEEAKKPQPKKMKEHLAPLFDGQDLSEDFKTKAETIFTAVVNEKANEVKSFYESQLSEAIDAHKADLAEKVDEYLSYVVEEWYKENKIALERSLRAEIAENFMEGLRNLFTDNFITIPEEKVDVLEVANTKIEELTNQVNEEIKSAIEKTKRIAELEAKIAFSESLDGLTVSEAEKLKSLSEGLEFETVEEYKTKLNVLKETYFKAPSKQTTADTLVENITTPQGTSSVMEAYTRTLSKIRK
jgi:hypothetical protein